MDDDTLHRDKTRQFAVACYRGRKRFDGTYLTHTVAVASLAEQFGVRLFRQHGMLMPLDRVTVDCMWHAGLLHSVIDLCGSTWDDVLSVTNLTVADFVAALSRDNRLPRPRRTFSYVSQLLQADIPVQAISLADCCYELTDAVALLRRDPNKAKSAFALWSEEAADWVRAIEHATRHRFPEEWSWCNDVASRLLSVFKYWRRRQQLLQDIQACPGTVSLIKPVRGVSSP